MTASNVPKTVLVVGAGLIGASIAYHLARRGARVTVVDRGVPAGEATEKSFAWINASHGNPKPYYDLRLHAMLEYRRLQDELGGALAINWNGCLDYDEDPETLRRMVREHAAWGYAIHLVERAEIEEMEPNLFEPPDLAAFSAFEGSVDPVDMTRVLLAAAERAGAALKLNCAVREVMRDGAEVTGLATEAGVLQADCVVLAAGVATEVLAEQAGEHLPMANRPGLLIHSKPTDPCLRRVVLSPGAHMKQGPDGRVVAGEDFGGGDTPNDPEAEGRQLLARVAGRLRTAEPLDLDNVTVGVRPIPKDGFPVIGFGKSAGNLYLSVMHSGVSLAPAVARFAAEEILTGIEADLLAPYRPGRFAAG